MIATIVPDGVFVDLDAIGERGVQLCHGAGDLGWHRRDAHETSWPEIAVNRSSCLTLTVCPS